MLNSLISSLKPILIVLSIGSSLIAKSQQTSYPEVGKPIPKFSLKAGNSGKHLTSASLNGKPYILDFWTTGCGACVAAFPKMDSLQKLFKNEMNVILVGMEEKYRDVRKFYDVYRHKDKLSLTSVFDSASFRKMVPSGVPHLVWVGSDGIVKAITTTVEVNADNIAAFIRGNTFSFEDVSYKAITEAKRTYSGDRRFLIDGNGGSDTAYAFRSIIALWKPEMGTPSFPIPIPEKQGTRAQYQINGAPLDVLLLLAFFGTTYFQIEHTDTYPLPQFSEEALSFIKKRFGDSQRFSYSIEMPSDIATQRSIMEKMQEDLKSFFSLDISIREKDMSVMKLIVTDESRFSRTKSNSGKIGSSWAAENEVQTFTNLPVQLVMETLMSKTLPYKFQYLSNETGYASRLTFQIKAKIFSLQSIREGLKDVGLDIVPGEKRMKVLEITGGHQ